MQMRNTAAAEHLLQTGNTSGICFKINCVVSSINTNMLHLHHCRDFPPSGFFKGQSGFSRVRKGTLEKTSVLSAGAIWGPHCLPPLYLKRELSDACPWLNIPSGANVNEISAFTSSADRMPNGRNKRRVTGVTREHNAANYTQCCTARLRQGQKAFKYTNVILIHNNNNDYNMLLII